MTAERWQWWRDQTPALEKRAYMNTGFTGLLSNPVAEAMEERIQFELSEGWTTKAVMDEGRETRTRLTELFAKMFGANAHEVALTTSTSLGVSSVIAAFEMSEGDRLLTTSVEHGAGAVPLYHSRMINNTEVEFVPVSPDDSHGEIAERFVSAIDEHTKVVGLSEISFSTGQLLPIKPIVEAAHRHGAIVVIDGAQTGGHIPIDVRESGVDAYAIPAQKWLCGPRGIGALYVSPEALPRLQPVLVDMSYADEWDLEGTFSPKEDVAGKFQFAAVPPILAAGTVAAIEQYFESGPQAIWDRVRQLTEAAEARFQQIDGVTIGSSQSDQSRSGLFCFRAGDIPSTDLAPYLQSDHDVVCRAVRQENVVRLSLHAFNNEDDIDQAARGVEQALRDGGVPSID